MWFDHVEHMEEGQEKNKEWENFWWTVDEDMFTYVMKSKLGELIEDKLNQEFPEEVEIRENQDFESDEEMPSETEETDDDESEPNNENVNNDLDSANMATNLESAMKIAEEEDLWIGDSGALSHMMGSEEHVFNKNERIPSTTPGAEPPRDAKDSGSARSHPTHLETSSSDRP